MWSYAIGPGASTSPSGATRELTAATGRSLTRSLQRQHVATFTLAGAIGSTGPAAQQKALIIPDVTDLWIWREQVLMHHGRVTTATPQGDRDRWVTQYQSIDYRGKLVRDAQIEGTVPTFSGVDQHSIAWQLVQHRQAQTGGDWGITEGVGGVAGVNRDMTDLTVGKSIGEAIEQLSRRAGGFDWQINPNLELDRWTPRRTRSLGVVLDYGGAVVAYTGSTTPWANTVNFSGAQTTTPVTVATTDVATDPRGRRSTYGSSPNMSNQTSLGDAANGMLADVSTANRTWRVTLKPGRYPGTSRLDLGDIVKLSIPPEGISGLHRVTEMQHSIGDDGDETTVVELVEEDA